VTASRTGGWVRRVGSAGGGRTYRRRRPINFYGALGAICVVGISSVALARYDYQHPPGPAAVAHPTTADIWYAALGISTCGHQQPALAQNPTAIAAGAYALPSGVIEVHPLLPSQTGHHATLQLFVSGYTGLEVTKTALVLPPVGKAKKPTHWTTGTTCPAGTKDAGKKGHVEIASWANASSSPTLTTNPADVRFTPNMLITIGFVPQGVVPPMPPNSAIRAMFVAHNATTTTLLPPTTSLPGTTTTAPATTTSKP